MRFRFAEPQPRFIQTMAGGDLWGAVAREVVEAYGDDIAAHPVGTGPFRLAEWRRSSKIVLVRNPTYRDVALRLPSPTPTMPRARHCWRSSRAARLPMIDRVEVSVIEEQQPRWLSFLQKQQDLLERLPNEFVNIAIPNNQLAPNLAQAGHADVPHAGLGRDADGLQHGEPGRRRLHAGEGRAAARAEHWRSNTEQEIRLERKGQAVPAQSPLVPNTMGFDPDFRSEGYDPRKARALLDTYGYVDRDGDGWREQPDGSPLRDQISTQPDQASRRLDELQRKDYAAIGIRTEFKQAKWPENLRNVRAGNYMVWGVGSSAAAPDGQPAFDRTASHPQGRAEPRALQQQAVRRDLRPHAA